MAFRFILLTLVISLAKAQVNLDNVTAGCDAGGCSGHGSCQSSVCICDDFWSSNADFVLVEDCTLSLIAMYTLWSIVLAWCIYVLYKTLFVIVIRFENFFIQRKLIKGYSLMKNPGLISVIFLYFIGIPCVMIAAIIHFVDPGTRIGFNNFTTAIFFLGKAGLYLGACFLQGPLLEVALRGEPMFASLVKFNNRFNVGVNMLSIVVGGIPFITLMYYQLEIPHQFEVIRAYYFCQAIALGCQGVESFLVKLRLNHVLKRAKNLVMSSEKSSSILAKVNAVQDTIILQAFLQMIINVVFGAVPYLLNKHNYLWPVSWLAIPAIAKNIALQIELDEKGSKTLRDRLKRLIGAIASSSNHEKTSSAAANNQKMQITSGKVANVSQSENGMVPSSMMFETRNPIMKPLTSQVGSTEGMEDLLHGENSEEYRAKFAQFVRERFASDSLHFYDAVCDYEAADGKSLKAKGKAIMTRFIVEGAPEAIDLPHELRLNLLSINKNQKFIASTFEEPKKLAFDLLKSNFYNKFATAVSEGY